jgi:hypothetical protein
MNKDFDGKHRNCHLQGKAVNHPVTTAELQKHRAILFLYMA